jgi:WD40 repeat protein
VSSALRQVSALLTRDRRRIWSLKTYELLHTFTGHNKGIRSLALSPKGVLVSVGQDKAINGESRCRAGPRSG